MKRSMPFPGFSRGVPIIGGPQQPEAGQHGYLLSYLVQCPGEMPQANMIEVVGDGPIHGGAILQVVAGLEKQLAEQAPDKAPARVVLLCAPIKIKFTPQAVLDAERAEKDALLATVANA